ncbi:MAG: fibronectin type III domain-containing protein, partial [Leadbetterella sp.]|nr:fibronectin type III domain-containing protein [Leadbetterella sp.]
MKKAFYTLILWVTAVSVQAQFRVKPYLLPGDTEGRYRLTWITEQSTSGTVYLWQGTDTLQYSPVPVYAHELTYSRLEESERSQFPDMFRGANWKHTLLLSALKPNTVYHYEVVQGKDSYSSVFKTAPVPGEQIPVRFVAMADSETDPEGRTTHRGWSTGVQHPQSTGRPAGLKTYPITETEGFIANLKQLKKNTPDFWLLAGDLVQGGGYQRAWDEFFFRPGPGKFDDGTWA